MERRTALLWIALSVPCLTCSATTSTIENVSENAPSKLVSSLEHETSVPVHDNRFIVDKDIQSIQIIINTDDVQTIKILGPAGFEIMPLQNTPEVNWQQFDKLYAITLKRPAIGQWEIKGKMQATPKIIIDSTLKMITPDFPNNLFRGETLSISAYLTDNNKRITSNEILSQTQFFATLHNVATLDKYKIFLNDEETNPTGIYRFNYVLQSLPGVYRINIQATSLLFQRQQEQQFYLYDYPAVYTTKVLADTDELLIEVDLQSPLLDEETCHFTALYMGKDGELTSVALTKVTDKRWQLISPITDATYYLNILLNGYTKDRRLINVTFPDVDIFSLYQKNLSEIKALWDAKSESFWLANQLRQNDELLGFSKGRYLEQLLFAINQELPQEAIPLRQFNTHQQLLLKYWKPIIFEDKQKLLVDEMNKEMAQQKAKIEAQKVLAAKKEAKKIAAKAHEAKISPWRKVIISLIIVFGLLLLAVFGGILWIFQKEKVLAIVASLRVMMAKIKELKDKLKETVKEKTKKKDTVPAEELATDDSATQQPAESEAAQPEAAQPEAVQPEAAQPEAAQPEAAQPEAAQPEAAQPEAETASAEATTEGEGDNSKAVAEAVVGKATPVQPSPHNP